MIPRNGQAASGLRNEISRTPRAAIPRWGVTSPPGSEGSGPPRRLKENVRTLEGALDTVRSLRGVSYDATPEHHGERDDPSARFDRLGLIAQEVEQVLPQLVRTDEGTGLKSIGYLGLVPVLVEAIKEQSAMIDELRQRLDALE